ncbi:hypothetical protein GGR51DRAFT_505487 [Nemania sp. FL0031]|nr:hypothetical protein GGR51DRAFT_505487 [Nemania sp. FL0031]
MGKWNSTIVLAALRAVEDFQPCIWVPDFGIDLSKEATESTETRAGVNKEKNTTRGLKGSNKGNKSQSGTDKEKSRKRRKQPDGGAVSLEEEPKRKRLGKFEEFFPKEIKTASNWNSQKLRNGEYTDKETGKWIGTVGESNENAPIRQAYTYCVDFRCRYGCILTTREAFMFRIKPRETDIAAPKDDLTLVERVQVDGLMEFVSVPWDNGCDTDHHEYRQWTVNLALWFMHILAGNNHKLGWDWGLRDDEFVKIKQQESPKRGTESQSLDSRTSAMKKRSRAEQAREEAQAQEIIDNPNFSFTSSVIRQPSMSLGGYTESLVSDNNSTIDGDLESRPLKKRLRSAFSQVDKGQGGSSGSGLGS